MNIISSISKMIIIIVMIIMFIMIIHIMMIIIIIILIIIISFIIIVIIISIIISIIIIINVVIIIIIIIYTYIYIYIHTIIYIYIYIYIYSIHIYVYTHIHIIFMYILVEDHEVGCGDLAHHRADGDGHVLHGEPRGVRQLRDRGLGRLAAVRARGEDEQVRRLLGDRGAPGQLGVDEDGVGGAHAHIRDGAVEVRQLALQLVALGGATCRTLLVSYGLIRFMRGSSCQGSPCVAA